MGRKTKQDVKINNTQSLEGLMQETYNDACMLIIEAQSAINELSASSTPETVNDHTNIAKEKATLLKVKDSGIGKKLELAKLQAVLIKNGGNIEEAVKERSDGKASASDFSSIREMLKQDKIEKLDVE